MSNSGWYRNRAAALTILFIMLAGGSAPAMAQESLPSSSEQGATHMDQIDMANPHYQPLIASPEKKPEQMSPFFSDSTFNAELRTYYFNRKNFDDSRNEAWALGGSLAYKSGYLADRLAIGAVAYTSQRLYGPGNRDGTQLLQPGQEGYSVLGQLYGEIKITDQLFAAIGRKEYNTPYINADDSRMTPNTFQGYSLYGKAGGEDDAPAWRYGAGYITKIKEKNSDEFVWMSHVAGANVNRGVYIAGANFKQGAFSIGAINYYSNDIINIFYTEAKYTLPLTDRYQLQLSAQYSDQRSTGDNLLTGNNFSTHQAGVNADLGVGAALLTMAYTNTANGADMQSPWGGYSGYTSVMIEDFFRAGESALMLRASYDFSGDGLEGLSASALRVHGSGVNKPLYNEDETDLDLQWVPKNGALKGFSFRTRYARVNQRGGGDPDINDFRLIVNYDF